MENNINNIPPKISEKNGMGPIIGSIIVILVVIAGGIYFWISKISKYSQPADNRNQEIGTSSAINLIENEIDANQFNTDNEDLNNLKKNIDNL